MAQIPQENTNWKRIAIGALFKATFLVVGVVGMGYVLTLVGRGLGWPEEMIWMSANVGGGIVLLAFLIQAMKPVISIVRKGPADGQHGHTAEMISIAALGTRRRYYLKQLGKIVGGVMVAGVGAFNLHGMVAMRGSLYPAFQDLFGTSAQLNYQLMMVLMGISSILGIGIASRAWLNRHRDPDEAIIEAVRDG